jgi:hypothetical protein
MINLRMIVVIILLLITHKHLLFFLLLYVFFLLVVVVVVVVVLMLMLLLLVVVVVVVVLVLVLMVLLVVLLLLLLLLLFFQLLLLLLLLYASEIKARITILSSNKKRSSHLLPVQIALCNDRECISTTFPDDISSSFPLLRCLSYRVRLGLNTHALSAAPNTCKGRRLSRTHNGTCLIADSDC